MSELEKVLRKSVGKLVTIRYLVPDLGEFHITGTLKKVTDEIIQIEAIMLHHINRKTTVLIGVGVKE